ncbi:germination protein M [Natranaerovirga pectinivora]|uniref:Germination protein M n=1 Tax=Natranaerovirga pectinivora TaxID=682400 RepID=A0A4R3MPA2_9FIRM|nr:GerMN domain-containing protein [Natranaerovirga pectinivora]TCT16362.1 germination protein M [Natranaerovirga pectinivora]
MTRISKLIILVILALMFLSACTNKNISTASNIEGIKIDLFYINQNKTDLVVETVDFLENDKEAESFIKMLIDKLKSNPSNRNYLKTIPDNLDVKGIRLENRTARIIFDNNYSDFTPLEEVLVRAAIVKTLTQIKSVDFVEFFINDQPLKDRNDKPLGLMKSSDFVGDINNSESVLREVAITLYFSDAEGTGLVPERVNSTIYADEPIEKKVIELLIEGPTSENLSATVPRESRLKHIYVKDGIAYIDFNEDFRSRHWGGSTGEILTIYSIVNSLAELPNISRVQFLINGLKVSEFKGHVAFDVLFERNLDIVIY